jgi:hypothetical protein
MVTRNKPGARHAAPLPQLCPTSPSQPTRPAAHFVRHKVGVAPYVRGQVRCHTQRVRKQDRRRGVAAEARLLTGSSAYGAND